MTDRPGLAECTQGHRQGPKTELKPNLVFGGVIWFVILFSFLFFSFSFFFFFKCVKAEREKEEGGGITNLNGLLSF